MMQEQRDTELEAMIQHELERRRTRALSKLMNVATTLMLDQFASIFSKSYRDEDIDAYKIADFCELTEEEIRALSYDETGIFEYLCKQQERAREEEAYDRFGWAY